MAWSGQDGKFGSSVVMSLALLLGSGGPGSALVATPAATALQIMCTSSGEQTSGFNKICY